MVGLIRLNCELFAGRSLYKEQVGSPRLGPRAFGPPGLEALPFRRGGHTTPSPRARGQSIQMGHCHIKAVAHLFYGRPFTVSSDDSPSNRGKRDRSSGQLEPR